MGLPGQALAAGFGTMLQTKGAMMIDEERQNAQRLREENLLRLRRQYDSEATAIKDAREDKRDELKNDRAIAAEDRKADYEEEKAQRTADGTLTDYVDADGIPMTRGQVIAAGKLKKDALAAEASAAKRGEMNAAGEAIGEGMTQSPEDTIAETMGGEKKKPKSLMDSVSPAYTGAERDKIKAAEQIKIQSAKKIAKEEERIAKAEDKAAEIVLREEERRQTQKELKAMGGPSGGSNSKTAEERKQERIEKDQARKEARLSKLNDIEELNPAQKAEKVQLQKALGIEESRPFGVHSQRNDPAAIFGKAKKGIVSTAKTGTPKYKIISVK